MAMLEVKDLSVNYDSCGCAEACLHRSERRGDLQHYRLQRRRQNLAAAHYLRAGEAWSTGHVEFMGKKLPGKPHEIVKKGIVHVRKAVKRSLA